MKVPGPYRADMEDILGKQGVNGGKYWATADGRLGVGSPLSTLDCVLILHDLGLEPAHPVLKGAADLILGAWREDGRFRLAPGAIYPCHTANAARALGRLGFGQDARLQRTFEHLLDTLHESGGWRCNSFKFGRGPETEAANPGPTLWALDAFRFSGRLNKDGRLNKAVGFLLSHWSTRKPLGPCHYGIGSLFMQVEYPFLRYNLFYYLYILSFYDAAKEDPRFLGALKVLESKLNSGQVVVENPNRKLAGLSFCRRLGPSQAATTHYREILRNLGRA